MTTTRRLFLLGLILASFVYSNANATAWAAPPGGSQIDVYILYSGKQKAERDALVKSLDEDLNVRTYNVDLLKLADYSGKQKAVAKIDKASIVISLGDEPAKILKGTKIASDLIIVANATRKFYSKEWNLNVVGKDADVSKLPSKKKHITVTSVEDLGTRENPLKASAIVVEDSAKHLYSVVAYLVTEKLDA